MFASQRIRRLSWVLAGAYLLCGVMGFVITQKVALVYSGLRPPLMLPTRVLLWVGPYGWVAVIVLLATLLILRDLRFHSHWVASGIKVALWMAMGGVFAAVACLVMVIYLQPICVFGSTISQ
jgi:hypothetical protein